MKNTLLILFAATTLALGAVCVIQWQNRAAQQNEIIALRGEVEQKAREVVDLQAAQKLVNQQRRETVEQAGDLAAKLQAQREATAKAAARAAAASAAAEAQKSGKNKGVFGEFLSKMLEDPETRKMMRQQHRMMLDQLYAPFIKQMGFTPEEAAQFKDLLADNMMKGAEKASSLFGGGATNRAEMLNTLAAEQKSFDEQLKQLLGDTRYAQYKDYQETVGERMQMNQFRMQNATGESALTDQQTEQLLAFMKEEKQSVASATGQTFPGAGEQDAAKLEAMLSGESVEKLMLAQESVNQRVYDRAKGVLTGSQLSAFGKFQTNQLQMMRMGMNMARKFMVPEGSGEPAPANP